MIVYIQIAGICRSNMTCSNTEGSYKCECNTGYEKTVNDECTDSDECTTNTHDCKDGSQCFNKMGSYECQCHKGYTYNGLKCVQTSVTGQCSAATSENVDYSY